MELSLLNWVKVVANDEIWAYTRKHLEEIGKNVLDYNGVTVFPLGFRNEKASEPKCGDLIALIQRGKLTHIVEVLDKSPYIEGGWNHRIVRIVWWMPEIDWISLKPQSDFLGFDPTLMDGKPHVINNLKRFKEKWDSLEEFQQYVSEKIRAFSIN